MALAASAALFIAGRDARSQAPSAGGAAASQTAPGGPPGGDVLFRAQVDRVVLYAAVFDSSQHLVTGLPQDAFRVYQDGVHRNRRVGWQNAHVAIDDHSRIVICELYPAEDAASCSRFLELVIAHYADRGIPIERVMTDNGNGYRSHAFRDVLARHHIRHLRTKPYTPRTNGKAEAFIRILQREWAYAYAYHSSAHRARALPGYIRWYNTHRPHGSLNGHPPASRVSQAPRFNT